MYLSSNPLATVIGHQLPPGHYEIVQLPDRSAGAEVKVICADSWHQTYPDQTEPGDGGVELEDLTGRIEMVLYPEAFEANSAELVVDHIVTVTGRTDYRNESLQLIGEHVTAEIERTEAPVDRRVIVLRPPRQDDFWQDVDVLQKLGSMFESHEGDDLVVLEVIIGGVTKRILSRKHHIAWDEELAGKVSSLVGVENTRIATLTSGNGSNGHLEF